MTQAVMWGIIIKDALHECRNALLLINLTTYMITHEALKLDMCSSECTFVKLHSLHKQGLPCLQQPAHPTSSKAVSSSHIYTCLQ